MSIGAVGWILFGLLVVIYISFARHMARRVESLAEYIEFLLQNRAVYEDHRQKYAGMLRETAQLSPHLTPVQLGMCSKRSIDSISGSLHKEIVLSNAVGRASIDAWLTYQTLAEGAKAARTKT